MATPTSATLASTTTRTRNILGPLTTVFTAPQDCNFALVPGTFHKLAFRAQTCFGDDVKDVSTCWPQATTTTSLNVPQLDGWGFYSPGLSCPAGYTSACYATQGSVTGWSMQFAMDPGETAVGCCPTNFSCAMFEGGRQTCIHTASDTESFLTAHCTKGSFISVSYPTFPIVFTTDSSITYVTSLAVAAPMIQINRRSEDLTLSTYSTSSLTPSSSSPSSYSNGSISSGALAGAVISGVLGASAIAAAIFFFIRQRKKRNKVENMFTEARGDEKQEGGPKGMTELPANQRPVELTDIRDASELLGYQRPAELSTS